MPETKDLPAGESSQELPRFHFKEWREAKGWSQAEMAEILGVTKATVSRIELGQRSFTIDYLIDFAQACGIPTALPLLSGPTSEPGGKSGKRPRRRKNEKPELPLIQRTRELRKLKRNQ